MSEATYLHSTRTAYDTVAADYARILTSELDTKPLDRAMLGAFAELVGADGAAAGPVAELGCGPGRVTAHLHRLGVADVFGVDLSPGMVEVARRAHPELRFEVGSMLELDLPERSLRGVLSWYSIVHTPRELLPRVFAEFHRVLAPGGHLLLAFKVGDRLRHLTSAYGHDGLALDVYWTDPDLVAETLAGAGFTVDARLVREPDDSERATQGRQAFFLARRPAEEGAGSPAPE
ncbi:Methyltransferase domain-containing protein [Actinacidiphila yanglinensis]|uniref:Methyltransferase domain-containing protein n=1 Tax=Actinacidiphila yanglinensis TaxID=310779 RepID=A0A1H6DV95_9ACTN|nr:class I SAM-dependent methyltransferase [Actinacidiphila yanglinensis]SEG88636.1 Methyltransferase domain-containing protein [Actinacidiphila yanglinensis]